MTHTGISTENNGPITRTSLINQELKITHKNCICLVVFSDRSLLSHSFDSTESHSINQSTMRNLQWLCRADHGALIARALARERERDPNQRLNNTLE